MTATLCAFCLKPPSDTSPWVKDNPGQGCTYGLGHDYGQAEEAKPKQQEKKPDKKLCMKCGLHPRNPTAATNGCAHEYPS